MVIILMLVAGLTVFYGLPWLHNKYGGLIPEPISPLVDKIVGLLKFSARVAIFVSLVVIAYWVVPPSAKYVERIVGDEFCLNNAEGTSVDILSNLNDSKTGSWKVYTFHDNFYCNWHLDLATSRYRVHGWNLQYPTEKYTDPRARFMVYSLNREIVYISDVGQADRESLQDYLAVNEAGQRRATDLALRIFFYWYDNDQEQNASQLFINGVDVTEISIAALERDADRDGIPNSTDEFPYDHRNEVGNMIEEGIRDRVIRINPLPSTDSTSLTTTTN